MQDLVPYRLPNCQNKLLKDPHVVIVGAGASVAACPVDNYGKAIPLLRNILPILGLTEALDEYDFPVEWLNDFEKLYSNIYEKEEYKALTVYLVKEVTKYFQSLVIPDEVTYYDYLLLSLTSKDAIISFNWDPFLLQAYQRNISIDSLPELIFPHGNVGISICESCHIFCEAECHPCPNCGETTTDMPLMFPVGKKDYSKEAVIRNEWLRAEEYLSHAAGITIYGYGAPETDEDALNLLKTSYYISNIIDIAPFTIINLAKNKEEQMQKWRDIFDQRMFLYCNSFDESLLWQNPRVSLETLFDAILQQSPRSIAHPYSHFGSLGELQKFAKTISDFEMAI